MVACNHCVFYNKLHFRTFLPRRKVHGQTDYSEAGCGIPVPRTMGNEVELPFFRDSFPKNAHFSSSYIPNVSLDRGEMTKLRLESKNDCRPTKINAEWTGLIS